MKKATESKCHIWAWVICGLIVSVLLISLAWADETIYYDPEKNTRIEITEAGLWGIADSLTDTGNIALPLDSGYEDCLALQRRGFSIGCIDPNEVLIIQDATINIDSLILEFTSEPKYTTIFLVEYEGYEWGSCTNGKCSKKEPPRILSASSHDEILEIIYEYGRRHLLNIRRIDWNSQTKKATVTELQLAPYYLIKEKRKEK